MKLKQKILTGYGVVFVLMGLVIFWAITNLVSLGKATDSILRENYRSILAAENMVDALERQDSGILLIFLGDVDNGIAQFRENEAEFLSWLSRASDNLTIPGEAELVRTIASGYSGYRHRFSALTDLPGAKLPSSASRLSIYRESIHPVFTNVRENCIRLRRLNEETMYTASLRAGEVARRAIWSTGLVAAAALFIAVVFSLFLAERIARPLRRFLEASGRISAGDYATRVPEKTGDELGLLAEGFNRMAEQLGRYHEINIERIISEKNKGAAILSSIEDGLVVFDTQLRVTGINPAARRMLDLPGADAETMQSEDVVQLRQVRPMLHQVLDTGAPPVVPEEERLISLPEENPSRHYVYCVTAIRGKEQKPTGVILMLRDVTRRREVERLKNEFIMAASHELRTPLTSLAMSIDLLREHVGDKVGGKDQDLLQAAHEEVRRMMALVNDLLDLEKMEAGRIEMDFASVPVPVLFAHVRTLFRGQLEARDISLASEPAADLPEIRADANKITWVLTNLISNALRYVSDGGHIDLMASRIGPYVHLSVRDDGIGIAPEHQSKIFQKFVQVKGESFGGSGLGLAICKEIVRAHGGTIWVESAQGKGSTFTFTVPVAG